MIMKNRKDDVSDLRDATEQTQTSLRLHRQRKRSRGELNISRHTRYCLSREQPGGCDVANRERRRENKVSEEEIAKDEHQAHDSLPTERYAKIDGGQIAKLKATDEPSVTVTEAVT